jgi:hypothetical protein
MKLLILYLSYFISSLVCCLLSSFGMPGSICLPEKQLSDSFCGTYLFSNAIGDIRFKNGMRTVEPSELWNEYDPNDGSIPIPDSIIVFTSITNYSATFGDEPPGEAIKKEKPVRCTVRLQLKFSEDFDCLFVRNPILSKEIVLLNKKLITSGDYILKDPLSPSVSLESPYVSLESKVGIKTLIKTCTEALQKRSKAKRTLYLNQLIVRTYLEPANGSAKESCLIEYIHPVCAKVTMPAPTR